MYEIKGIKQVTGQTRKLCSGGHVDVAYSAKENKVVGSAPLYGGSWIEWDNGYRHIGNINDKMTMDEVEDAVQRFLCGWW